MGAESNAPPAPAPPPELDTGADAATADILRSRKAGGKALRGSVVRSGGYIAGILLSLVTAPLIIRHLGVADFGRYVTVLSLITIVAGFTEGGLNSIVLREYATLRGEERRVVMRAAVGIRIVLTLAGVAIAVAFSVLAGYGPRMVVGTALAGAALMLQLLQSLLSVTLQSELRFGWATAADLVRQAVNAVLVVALVLAGAGLVPLLAAAIPAAAASLVFTLPLVVGRTPLRPSFHTSQWWDLIREAVPWAAIAAVNVVYFRLALVLMSVIAVAAETGYFATSFRVVEVLIGIPGLLITAAFPILARAVQDDRVRFAAATRRLFELSLIAGTWLVVCLEVDAGFAIHILAGNKADPAITVLRIQGIAVIGTFISMACGFPLLTLRRYRETLIANLMSLVLVGILTVALVPSMGANGAALAAVIAEGALALTQATILTRVAPDVRLSIAALPIVAVAGLLAVGAGLAAPVHPVIGAILASVVYVAVLRLLGRFPPEAREVLASRWRPASR